MKIANKDSDKSVIVIAEIGNNHEGNFDTAMKMVEAAAASGVDIVKFQTFQAALFVNPRDEARMQRMKGFELSYAQFEELAKLARSLGLIFLSTPLDIESADFLGGIADGLKIASGDNTFYPLIKKVLNFGLPTIISTGVAGVDELDQATNFVLKHSKLPKETGLALLHCVTSYPTPADQANLRTISFLKNRYGWPTGYSDHTLGIDACVAAVAMGARIVEKHFTLDKNYSSFRDHQLSAEPAEMKLMIEKIRLIESMLGVEEKNSLPCEAPLVTAVRRSVFSRVDIPQGTRIQADHLICQRPGGGIPPEGLESLIGKIATRTLPRGEMLSGADIV